MELTIKLLAANGGLTWSFNLLRKFINMMPKNTLETPAKDALSAAHDSSDYCGWVIDFPSREHLDLHQSVNVTTAIDLPCRRRNNSIQEAHSIASVRQDTRRYAVYLPNYDFLDHAPPSHYPVREGPIMSAPAPAISYQTFPCDLQPPSRRSRQLVHESENIYDADPPPQYSAADPYPIRQGRMIESRITKEVDEIGQMPKESPDSIKDAQAKNTVRRARGKMQWLEKYNFLSAQNRPR